jgi:glucuronate isomerase
MGRTIIMQEDRLFPSDPTQRQIARRLYGAVKDLPIISPHGHTDPRWYAENTAFPDPATLFLIPDHYIFRMLYSKGVPLEKLGVPREDGGLTETDPRKIWRLFAENYYLFRGTPSRMWLEHVFFFLFGIDQRLNPANADEIYDKLAAALKKPEFRTRALFDRFNIEALATTDSPLSSLEYHKQIAASDWKGKVVPAFRPDLAVDPEFPGFAKNVARLGEITGENTAVWEGYLKAMAARRRFFKEMGCTSQPTTAIPPP